MEISERILQFKYHIAGAGAAFTAVFALIKVAPRLLDVLAYFWPLLVSTALFLAVVVVFGRISPPPLDEISGVKTGEGLLDYVAGQPPELIPGDSYKFD
ncbi:hypothetical protein V2J09_020502 [Rumex salicifolius]